MGRLVMLPGRFFSLNLTGYTKLKKPAFERSVWNVLRINCTGSEVSNSQDGDLGRVP